MARLIWDAVGQKTYETGVDHGVLYVQRDGKYPKGVAWNGLTSVQQSPSGAEDTALYADNIKYLNMKSAEELGLTIGCYTYPDEWMECDGTAELVPGVMLGQQGRRNFGLCYRTKIGNDTEGDEFGYKLHLIYNCSASPSDKSYNTVNDSPDAIEFSYEVTTTPIPVDGYRPIASVEIDSTKVSKEALAALEEKLYGKAGEGDENDPYLPLPEELMEIFSVGG